MLVGRDSQIRGLYTQNHVNHQGIGVGRDSQIRGLYTQDSIWDYYNKLEETLKLEGYTPKIM
jgi:hypothetical protein